MTGSKDDLEIERQKIIRLGMQQKDAIDALRARAPKSKRLIKMEQELIKLCNHLRYVERQLR